MTLKELREQRAKLIADARAIYDLARSETRDLTPEEGAEADRMMNEAAAVKDKIADEERRLTLEREEAELAAERQEEETRQGQASDETAAGRINLAFRSWLEGGTPIGQGVEEFRALSAGVNTEGGFIVVPEEFVRQLIKAIDDIVFMRGLATVLPLTSAASVGIPSLDNDPSDATWTTEILTGSDDTAMDFGKRVMTPNALAKRIKITNLLLRIAALPAEQIVRDRMAYKFAITQEKAYLSGSGSGQPLGVFTASASGVPVGRDVSNGNTATAITFDGLINAKYSLKAGYWANSQWLFHRDAIKQIALIQDTTNQYIWQQSKADAEPDRLLGRPVNMSEYVPNTFTTGLYVGMLADFQHYWIVDSLLMQMQRLVELYAETNQVGFIGRYEGDGAPVLAEAFARVTLA